MKGKQLKGMQLDGIITLLDEREVESKNSRSFQGMGKDEVERVLHKKDGDSSSDVENVVDSPSGSCSSCIIKNTKSSCQIS